MPKAKLKPYWGAHCKNCQFIGTLLIEGKPADIYLSCGLTKYLVAYENHKDGNYETTGLLGHLHKSIGESKFPGEAV